MKPTHRTGAWADFDPLWSRLLEQFQLGPYTHHGPDHWRRVESNGIMLADSNGADLLVVKLFAVFHDSRRLNESLDPGHGGRAAALASKMHGDLFQLESDQLELLLFACRHHHEGMNSAEPTIGACWDADRLDLPRVGIRPNPEFMSTAKGKELAINDCC